MFGIPRTPTKATETTALSTKNQSTIVKQQVKKILMFEFKFHTDMPSFGFKSYFKWCRHAFDLPYLRFFKIFKAYWDRGPGIWLFFLTINGQTLKISSKWFLNDQVIPWINRNFNSLNYIFKDPHKVNDRWQWKWSMKKYLFAVLCAELDLTIVCCI